MTEVSVHPSRKAKPGAFIDWTDDRGNTFHGLTQDAIAHFGKIHTREHVSVYMEPKKLTIH